MNNPNIKMNTHMVGELSSQPLEMNEHVKEVVNSTRLRVEEKTGLKIASMDVHSYKTQLVAGMNYFVKTLLKTENGLEKIAHLRIYRDLSDKVQLTAVELDKTLEDNIEYFQ